MADSYNKYAAVTLVSLLENTLSPVEIHLLYDELKNNTLPEWSENLNKYKEIELKYNTKILFHHVDIPEWCSGMPALRFFTLGTLLRLFIPDLLPSLNRVIYLDCDIVVRGDIKLLWDLDMGVYALAARPHYDDNPYFNAGVLLLNLEIIRQNYDFTRDALQFLSDNLGTARLDQDALNHVFGDTYYQLGQEFNYYPGEQPTVPDTVVIIHYAWVKPWKTYDQSQETYEFWKYFSMTPWCRDLSCLVDNLIPVSDLSPEYQEVYINHLIILPIQKRCKYFMRLIWLFILFNWKEFKLTVSMKIRNRS